MEGCVAPRGFSSLCLLRPRCLRGKRITGFTTVIRTDCILQTRFNESSMVTCSDDIGFLIVKVTEDTSFELNDEMFL